MAGQSIGDRFVAAQHTIIGSDMSKSVCKATTSEVMGPKKKHLDYLNSLTSEPNVNIPELADILVERSKQLKWVIVFKSLITTHHLMCYGNERFLQHLASRNSLFNLSQYVDRNGVQGYDMSTYIKRYAKYLNEKAVSYRVVAYDFTRVRRGKADGVVRSLDTENLLKTLPVLQQQLDALLDFDATSNELTNGVINAAFMLIFKDLIRLFACYNDGIINLLEKYFEMKKSHCKEALDLYKKFLTRMNKVSELLKVAEQVGIDKGDIPDLTKAPSSLLDALEQHLSSAEGKKPATKPNAPDTSSFYHNFESTSQKDTKDLKSPLQEEEKRLNEFKQKHAQDQQKTNIQGLPMTNNFQAAASSQSQPTSSDVNLLDASSFTVSQPQPTQDFFEQLAAAPAAPFGQPAATNPMQQNFGFAQNPFPNNQPAPVMQPNMFANSPFGNSTPSATGNDLLAPTLTATNVQPANSASNNQAPGSNLEASLANVMANFSVRGGQKANLEFQPRPERKLTGGNSYIPVSVGPTTNYNMSPMHAMHPMQMPPTAMQPQMGMTYPMMQPVVRPPMPYQQMQPAPAQQYNPNNPFGPML